MTITRRVYLSLPADPNLPPNLNQLKWAIVEEIEKLRYTPEIFTNPRGTRALASAKSWHPRDADDIARRCAGAAVLGMARWNLQTRVPPGEDSVPVLLPTEFNYYEGALARTLGLPTLVLVQKDVMRRVVFDMNFAGYLSLFPPEADVNWIHSDDFRVPFEYWKAALEERVDVFSATAADRSRSRKKFALFS